jgi:hypothetical protein
MADVSIYDAIALFEHSETARGAKGPVGKWPQRTVEALRYFHDIEEVGYAVTKSKSKGVTNKGKWKHGHDGFDLRLNSAYFSRLPKKDRLPAVSLVLVHEGVHAAMDHQDIDFQRLYEEMAARKLPILYYRELSGPGVVDTQTGRRVVLGKSDAFDEYHAMSEAMDKDQLVDYVLDIETYTKRSYLDEDWVVANFDHWGGMANRWPGTRRLYVKILLPVAGDTYYAARILGILESISSKQEWDKMINAIKATRADKSLWALQSSFESLLGDRSLSTRIGLLERRWGTALTERPGR